MSFSKFILFQKFLRFSDTIKTVGNCLTALQDKSFLYLTIEKWKLHIWYLGPKILQTVYVKDALWVDFLINIFELKVLFFRGTWRSI